MSDPPARTFTEDFRRFFLRGLVILLPSVLTLWIVVKAYQFVDKTIAAPINHGVQVALVNTARVWTPLQEKFDPTPATNPAWQEALAKNLSPQELQAERVRLRQQNIVAWWEARWYMDLIGLAVAIIAVYIAGRLLGGFVGRRIYRKLESLLTSVPIVKQVYPYVKQIVDFLFSDDQPIKFNRVVAVEYPRAGLWSIGFTTGSSMRAILAASGDAVSVFVPSSPTPFTGYTITVPRDQLIEIPVTVEEAIRFTVSGGVLVPEHQQTISDEARAALGGVRRPRAGGDLPGPAAAGGPAERKPGAEPGPAAPPPQAPERQKRQPGKDPGRPKASRNAG